MVEDVVLGFKRRSWTVKANEEWIIKYTRLTDRAGELKSGSELIILQEWRQLTWGI
jgi:hypothetical protein